MQYENGVCVMKDISCTTELLSCQRQHRATTCVGLLGSVLKYIRVTRRFETERRQSGYCADLSALITSVKRRSLPTHDLTSQAILVQLKLQ